MRMLFLTHAHNRLGQRAWIELTERGHDVRVALVDDDTAMLLAVHDARPELIIAPKLTHSRPPSRE